MRAITLTPAHADAAGCALRELREGGATPGDAQISLALMVMYVAERHNLKVEELVRFLVSNATGLAKSPDLFNAVFEQISRKADSSRLIMTRH